MVSWQPARAGTVVDFGYTEKAIDLYTGDAFVLPSGWLNPIGGCLPSIGGSLAHLMMAKTFTALGLGRYRWSWSRRPIHREWWHTRDCAVARRANGAVDGAASDISAIRGARCIRSDDTYHQPNQVGQPRLLVCGAHTHAGIVWCVPQLPSGTPDRQLFVR